MNNKFLAILLFTCISFNGYAQFNIRTNTHVSLLHTYESNPKVISKIKADTDVEFWGIAANEYYLKIKYKGKKGFIPRKYFYQTPELADHLAAFEKKKENKKKREQEELLKKQKVYENKHFEKLKQKYGKYASYIVEKKIVIGMTTDMVIESIGNPKDKNTLTTQFGKEEQWIYGDFSNNIYLYFSNNKLEAIQE